MAWRTVLAALALCGACKSGSSPAQPSQSPPTSGETREMTSADAQDPSANEAASSSPGTAPTRQSFVYVGGWDHSGKDYPVKTYALDRERGTLRELDSSTAFGQSPSYITPNPSRTRIYLVNEEDPAAGIAVGTIAPDTGVPSLLTRRDYTGGAFVFSAFHPSGKYLYAADYGGGKLVGYPVDEDGKLGEPLSTIQFPKAGKEPAMTHSVAVHPSGRWAYAPNKGLNDIAQLTIEQDGKLTQRASVATRKAEPRMISITPDGRFAYVMTESSSTVLAYAIGQDGLLREIDSEDALPKGFRGKSTGAHALVHPSGKWVYVSNRGADTIAQFAIGEDGTLTLVGHTPTEGNTPRDFDIDAEGAWLVVANQNSDSVADGNLVVFAIGADGKLTRTGDMVGGLKTPTAVSIVTP